MQPFPWPHYDQQTEVKNHSTKICWIPREAVCPMTRDQYPDGCWMISYPGGGLHAIYQPHEREEFQRDCVECLLHQSAFWSGVAGRDIDAPHIMAAAIRPTTTHAKPKASGKLMIGLADLGL